MPSSPTAFPFEKEVLICTRTALLSDFLYSSLPFLSLSSHSSSSSFAFFFFISSSWFSFLECVPATPSIFPCGSVSLLLFQRMTDSLFGLDICRLLQSSGFVLLLLCLDSSLLAIFSSSPSFPFRFSSASRCSRVFFTILCLSHSMRPQHVLVEVLRLFFFFFRLTTPCVWQVHREKDNTYEIHERFHPLSLNSCSHSGISEEDGVGSGTGFPRSCSSALSL